MAVVVEVAEDRTDLARLVGDAAVLRLDEALGRVQDEHAGAGAVEEVGPAVAVHVADGQRVALDRAADAVGAEADRVGHVLERPGDRRRQAVGRLEVERPFAAALADLHQQLVLALLQLERRPSSGPAGRRAARSPTRSSRR